MVSINLLIKNKSKYNLLKQPTNWGVFLEFCINKEEFSIISLRKNMLNFYLLLNDLLGAI